MTEKKYEQGFRSIKSWREDDRPREKLIRHGAWTLSDAELLALLIRSGTKGFSAMDAAKSLLETHRNLTGLSSCDYSRFKEVRGLGDAKAVVLAAAFEIVKRVQSEPYDVKRSFTSPEKVAKYYIPRFRTAKEEVSLALLLNSKNEVYREVFISKGSLNSSIVHPREVFKTAITESAASIILIHNHPSGNPEPSEDDIRLTKEIVQAGKIIDIKVLDHIIIAGNDYISLANEGIV